MTHHQPSRLMRAARIAATAFLGATAPVPAAFAEPVELIYNIFIPPQAGIVKNGLAPWAAEVEAASKGTLKLTIPSASIAPVPQLWDAVEDGLVDIALVVNAFRQEQIGLPTILNLPQANGSAEAVSRAWWETYEADFKQAGEYGPFLPLAGFTVNTPSIMATKTHVSTAEDLEGLKIRVEGPDQIKLFENLGATPVGQSGQASFELLTGGVVDAGLNPFGSGRAQGQIGVTDEITAFSGGFPRSGFTLVMLKERFDSLPPEAQEALLSTSGVELSAKLGAAVDAEENEARAEFAAAGATITEASPELLSAVESAGQFITDKWLAIAEDRGLDGHAVLEAYLARIAAGN